MRKFDNIIVILVEPQLGRNIGSIARVMKNFDFEHLRIISPRDGWPSNDAISLSAGAKEVIEKAKIYNNLEDAVSDINILYATASGSRDLNKEVITPSDLAWEINMNNSNSKIGLLLGKESSGLSNEDISIAHKIVTIPVGEYKSLNISQAMCVIAYEVFQNKFTEISSNDSNDELASISDINKINEFIFDNESVKNIFNNKHKKHYMFDNLRNIFLRIQTFTKKDIKVLYGIIKALANNKS